MRNFLLAFGLGLCLALPAASDSHDQGNRDEVLARIATERETAMRLLRDSITEGYVLRTQAPGGIGPALFKDTDASVIAHRQALDAQSSRDATAESIYRQTMAARILAATAGLPQEEASAWLWQELQEAQRVKAAVPARARAQLVDRLSRASGDAERARAFAYADGLMRTSMLEEEMLAAALRRQNGQDDMRRMNQLLGTVTRTNTTLRGSDIADDTEREAEIFIRQTQVEQEADEYRRLARTGRIRNPNTGLGEVGAARIQAAEDAESALAFELERKALKPNSYDILRFMLSEDERRIRARDIERSIAETPEYRALDFVGPGDADNVGLQYLARVQAIREQQQKVNDWRTGFIKGGTTGLATVDEFWGKLQTGAGDALRISGNAGEMSLDRVDQRIAEYHRDADAVARALAEAARLDREAAAKGLRASPDDLPGEMRDLLSRHQYIAGEPGKTYFTVPSGSRSLQGLKSDLNLPGDHVLNMLSGTSAIEIAATTALPGMAAGRVGAMLEGLNLGTRAAQAGAFATDLAVGVALDTGLEYGKTGKADPVRLGLEALMLQSTLTPLGKGSDALASKMSQYIKRPGVRAATETALKQVLGLPSEAALQTQFQAMMQGGEADYDMFLANLLNGAMSRGVSGVVESGLARDMPPEMRREILDRAESVERTRRVAENRLRGVLGSDLVGDAQTGGLALSSRGLQERMVGKVSEALESGQVTWSELKLLYADNQAGMTPLMKGLVEKRAKYFQEIVEPAQVMARAELAHEYSAREAAIRTEMADRPAEMQAALSRLEKDRTAELEAINFNPIVPGSSNVTSDIDRSIASDRVRRHLKDIYRGQTGDFEAPATSAQAYDVNEYIDVFPTIRKSIPLTRDLADLPVTEGDYAGLNHMQATAAQGMATAMLHMNDAQRAKYGENILAAAADPDLARRQLELARGSLDRADRELSDEAARLAKEQPGLLVNPADLATRARDNLYGQRTEAIRKKTLDLGAVERELAALPADADPAERTRLTDERNRLASELERDWTYALREGIETYASFAGLDSIVGDGQIPKGASPRALIQNDKYVRVKPGEAANLPEGVIGKEMTDEQVGAMLQDQVMMMTHHMNGFHEGHEGTLSAGSAMGKYAERAVLALKMAGKDLTQPPYAKLNEISEKMVNARKDPAALRKVMEDLGREAGGDGSAEAGLMRLAGLVEAAVPEARGLWDPGPMGLAPHGIDVAVTPDNPAGLRTQLASRRHLLDDAEAALAQYGPASGRDVVVGRKQALQDELRVLEDTHERRKLLGGSYLKKDWPQAEALEAKARELQERIQRVRELTGDEAAAEPLYRELWDVTGRLTAMKEDFRKAGGAAAQPPDAEDARLQRRMAAVRDEIGMLDAAEARYTGLSEDRQDRVAATEVPEDLARPAVTLDLPEGTAAGEMTVSAGGQSVTIRIAARAD